MKSNQDLGVLIDRTSLAEQLGCSIRWLQRLAAHNEGRSAFKIAGRAHYVVSDVNEWLSDLREKRVAEMERSRDY